MEETLRFLITQLVDHPDDVKIESQKEDERIILVIHAHPDDYGKIIGRGGRIIRAIRDLIKLMATKQNAYVDVELAEDNPTNAINDTDPTN